MKKYFSCLLLLTATLVVAQPGSLDTGFNGTGIKEFTFKGNTSEDSMMCSFLQPDGKLLVAIQDGSDGLTGYTDAVVFRFLPDGSRDNTFGIGGKVSIRRVIPDLSGTNAQFMINAIALRADGGIVLAGHVYKIGPPYMKVLTIASLNADGSKDDTFGKVAGNGTGYRQDFGYTGYTFSTVNIHSSGMVVAGVATLAPTPANSDDFLFFGMDRFGEPDYNFGDDGELAIDMALNAGDVLTSAVLHDKDTTLYVAGYSHLQGPTVQVRFAVAAFNIRTGAMKIPFGGIFTGTKLLPFAPAPGGLINKCMSMKFSADSSKLVLAGYNQRTSPIIDMMVYRISRATAASDITFSGDGVELYNVFSSATNYAYSLAVQSDDKIIIGGYVVSTSILYWAALRANADGTIDPTFGSSGKILYDGTGGQQIFKTSTGIRGLHYVPGGQKLVLVGSFSGSLNKDVLVKRLNADGSRDNAYGNQSDVVSWVLDVTGTIEEIYPRSDGKLWACGTVATTPSSSAVIALLNRDGSFDPSFKNNNNDAGVQYLSTFFPAGSILSSTMYMTMANNITETSDGKLLVSGMYRNSTTPPYWMMFIAQLKKESNGQWKRDSTAFGGTNGYITVTYTAGSDNWSDMIVQPDGKILMYGLVCTSNSPVNYSIVVKRFLANGTVDTGFNGTGTYSKAAYLPTSVNYKMQLALQPDKKIVCVGPAINPLSGQKCFMAFRLNENGTMDGTFNNTTNGTYTSSFTNAEARALCIKSDGKIVIGGYRDFGASTAQKDYQFVQLTTAGVVDPSFGTSGSVYLNRGFNADETVTNIAIESSGNIVATGRAAAASGIAFITGLRLSATGVPDKTFSDNGTSILTKGTPTTSAILDGSLFIFGQRNATEEAAIGIMVKMKLGTGPIIKITNLALGNLTKTFGDKPFTLTPVTNSPAQVYYSISQSGCATVHPTTGLVKITCSTVNSGQDIKVRAIQFPLNGYTADTAVAIIHVDKAIPRILFTTQGDTLGATFTLATTSSSPGNHYFTQINGNESITLLATTPVQAYVNAEGSSTVRVTFDESENYLSGSADAIVYGYSSLQLPEANTDQASLPFGEVNSVSIDILGNDAAYTGTLKPNSIDLDPKTPGQQIVYVSPSLGLFEADTITGLVTYTPFSGFIGEGDITYTVQDSKHLSSRPGSIRVAVAPVAAIPDLKATELITPNNDGLNEAFVIGYVNLEKENSLTIFDRNGQQLFSQTNYKNDWTGELTNGKQAEPGIYYFLFTEGNAGGQRELKGAVELRR